MATGFGHSHWALVLELVLFCLNRPHSEDYGMGCLLVDSVDCYIVLGIFKLVILLPLPLNPSYSGQDSWGDRIRGREIHLL